MSEQNNSERTQIYIAALLHDIGKFYQRADSGSFLTSRLLSTEIKALENIYCPSGPGGIKTHRHVLYTAQFISDYQPFFPAIPLDKTSAEWESKDNILSLAAGHHLAASQLSRAGNCIKEADCLSSGMDRNSDEAMKDDQDEGSWDSFRKKRMVSLFEGVGKSSHLHTMHLPVTALDLNKSLIPADEFNDAPDYKSLWQEFIEEFKTLTPDSAKSFAETLYYLLYKYTTSIPSSTINFPDVSLFDHSKTTAAMAVCLYDHPKMETTGTDPFLLVGGDLSGIQSYIYNIISENAAKNLKGRSFYIKLLSDSIVFKLIRDLDLFDANIVYNAGGSFFILAPNTPDTLQKLNASRKEIEENLFSHHGTELFLALDWISLSRNALYGIKGEHLGTAWNKLFEKRDVRKKQRYAEKIRENPSLFFNPEGFDSGGETVRDAITGTEIPKGTIFYNLEGKAIRSGTVSGDSQAISLTTWKQIELGKKLKKAVSWVIADAPLTYWGENEGIDPCGLGVYHYFLGTSDIRSRASELKGSADKVRLITLNGDDQGKCTFLEPKFPGLNNIFGFEFYGGNDYPRDEDGSPKTFDQLAGSGSFKRLGVLRMDVDNLGKVFREGMQNGRNTLSRYSALSRNLDWFFKGRLNRIWKETAPNSTYILYSGGDDLFLVGQWSDLFRLAGRINDEFREMTCNNENLTLSGGIILVTGKFPIKKAAMDCGEEENLAKSFPFRPRPKNALSIFKNPLRWDVELKKIIESKNRILPMIEKDILPKSFITKIGIYAESFNWKDRSDSSNESGNEMPVKKRKYNALWMFAYDMGRLQQKTNNTEAREFLSKLITDIVSNKKSDPGDNSPYHTLELLNIACRLAELELRTFN